MTDAGRPLFSLLPAGTAAPLATTHPPMSTGTVLRSAVVEDLVLCGRELVGVLDGRRTVRSARKVMEGSRPAIHARHLMITVRRDMIHERLPMINVRRDMINERHHMITMRRDMITERHDMITMRRDMITERHDMITVRRDMIQ